MQISAGSRVRNEHRLLGAKPTLAAGKRPVCLTLDCLKRLVARG